MTSELLLEAMRDPIFDKTPGEFIFGLVVVVLVLAVVFWVARQLHIL